MAYTPLPTVVLGDLWTAANHNTFIRDNFSELWKIQAAEDLIVGASASTAKRLTKGVARSLLYVNTSDELAYEKFGCFAQVRKNGTQAIPGASGAFITGWTSLADTDSMWDAANNRFVIQRNGVYSIRANGILTGAGSSTNAGIRIRLTRGATEIWLDDQVSPDPTPTVTRLGAHAVFTLEANDIIRLWVESNGGAITLADSLTFSGATLYTQFSIHRIIA